MFRKPVTYHVYQSQSGEKINISSFKIKRDATDYVSYLLTHFPTRPVTIEIA